jgi:hypothetical protein
VEARRRMEVVTVLSIILKRRDGVEERGLQRREWAMEASVGWRADDEKEKGGGRGVHVVSLYLESSLVGNGPLQGIAGRECEERGGHERWNLRLEQFSVSAAHWFFQTSSKAQADQRMNVKIE